MEFIFDVISRGGCARSLALLRPTIRAANSEVWASWNPRRKSDAIDDFLRTRKPEGAIVVSANWRDNPWFPSVLEEERQLDLALYPDRYDHIWEGDYVRAFEGAADLLDAPSRCREVCVGESTEELVATNTDERVIGASPGAERGHDRLE